MNYYNEHNPEAASWLRELIAAGEIPAGDVDTRSIEDVLPNDLRNYTQCHFFAGIGGWPLALRIAGVADSTPLWTGSCPCQPFSAAGKGAGVDDERHLWPAFHWLIERVRPGVVFGEQVASSDALSWLDLVHADLEGSGYTMRAADLCAAGIGAPHIRQRLYWVADAKRGSTKRRGHDVYAAPGSAQSEARERQRLWVESGAGCAAVILADSRSKGLERWSEQSTWGEQPTIERSGDAGWLGDGDSQRCDWVEVRLQPGRPQQGGAEVARASGIDWLPCADGKFRPAPTQSGIFPLVDGLPRGVVPSSYQSMAINANATAEGRAMRLRGYGNAIVPELAATFITACASI